MRARAPLRTTPRQAVLRALGLRFVVNAAVLVVLSGIFFALVAALPGDGADDVAIDAPTRLLVDRKTPIARRWVAWLVGHVEADDSNVVDRARADDASLRFVPGALFGPCAPEALGTSTWQRRSVSTILAERVPASLWLTAPPLLLSAALATAIAALGAARRHSVVDRAITIVVAVEAATPAFVFALALLWLFSVRLRWFPVGGASPPGVVDAALVERVAHAALPWTTLGVAWTARWLRPVRAAFLEVLALDHIRAARARGVDDTTLFAWHVLPVAGARLVTIAGLALPHLVGGALVVETVFAWPGMGRLQVEALQHHDAPLALATMLLVAAAVLASSWCADLVAAALDPRPSTSAQRGQR